MGESRNAYRVLVGRPEGKKPLVRPRRRWVENIKMDLREMGYDDREWINLAQDRDRWRAYQPPCQACSPLVCVGYPLECVAIPLATWHSVGQWKLAHVSATITQWYTENNVHGLDWPAQSPNLNPIEHLWGELDRRLRSREMRPTSIVQLSAMLREEWRRIPVDILHKLVESMPDRMAAVIAKRGGTTRF
ncbi:hypothetical protein ANN_00601 [Periplaneta americana]|uniref:Tc1-like transposase DDE domain-containing protein n=1 Tax=Periplaneta americana TaxID=6978 RepID=A0ABQ8TRE8_PERAM|nr:hypothetical protein ANN_00601 [Periplaneta americana]